MDSSNNQCQKEKNKTILYCFSLRLKKQNQMQCMNVGWIPFQKNFWIDWIVVKCRICNLVLNGSKITIDILENKYYL